MKSRHCNLPNHFFLLASRGSYFPLITSAAREHFLLSTTHLIDEMWLEDNEIPLKWQYPVGVLFDLYGTHSQLPWSLTVRFQNFPKVQLLRCPNDEIHKIVKSHFMNVLKEANHLKHGDNTKINSLSVEQDDLWEGLRENNYELFWKVNNKLTADSNSLKNIPIRICQVDQPIVQEPISPFDENGNQRTLGSVLNQILPQIFESSTDFPSNFKFLIHGITPPLETPIIWLSQNFSYPDNFLYVCVKVSEK